MAYVLLAVRWVLALTLLGTGASKVAAPAAFAEAVRRYHVVPTRLSSPVAWVIITVELLLAVGFGPGVLLPLCGAVGAGLFLCFAAATVWNLGHGRSFDCGCSAAERPISWRLAITDAAFASLCVIVALGPSGALALWGASAEPTRLAVSHTIPIPLVVITAVGLCRLAQQGAWLRPQRSLPSEGASSGALDIMHMGDPGHATASPGEGR